MLNKFDLKSQFVAVTEADLYLLKELTELDSVKIVTRNYASKGLLLHAFRYALFATRQNGEIIIDTEHHSAEQHIVPGTQNFPTVSALAKKALLRDCKYEDGANPRVLTFRRVAAQRPQGWSAGVMFSGDKNEVAKVDLCLAGLLLQPELLDAHGEIVVCGPESGRVFFKHYDQIKYLPYENKKNYGPFEISKKKTYVLQQLKCYRKLVIHSRIVLESNVLREAPSDFDIISPNVFFKGTKGEEPHPCFISIDPSWPIGPITKPSYSTTHIRPQEYMKLLSKGRAYVDGGAFAVTEKVLEACNFDQHLNWGECEDVEWCLRAQTEGFLVDFVPNIKALNVASKIRSLGLLPPFLARALRRAKAKLEAY